MPKPKNVNVSFNRGRNRKEECCFSLGHTIDGDFLRNPGTNEFQIRQSKRKLWNDGNVLTALLRANNAENRFKVGFKLQMYSIEGNKGQIIEKKMSVIIGNYLNAPDQDEQIWRKNIIEIPVL
jgi:hypothetical protein